MSSEEERSPCWPCKRREVCTHEEQQHCGKVRDAKNRATRPMTAEDALLAEDHIGEFSEERDDL